MNKCVEGVWHSAGMMFGNRRRCVRNAGFGPDEKYCRQHAEKFAANEPVATWYRADCLYEHACAITPIEVLKEQDKTLLVKDGKIARREAKESKWHRYFPERDQAVEFYRGRIRGLRAQAAKLEERLNEIDPPERP